jgi:Na+:H+ antiporter, NhaA family
VEYARELGLDVERFVADLDNGKFSEAVNHDFNQAIANNIKLPPALFINGLCLEGPRTKEALCAKIDTLLACFPG